MCNVINCWEAESLDNQQVMEFCKYVRKGAGYGVGLGVLNVEYYLISTINRAFQQNPVDIPKVKCFAKR